MTGSEKTQVASGVDLTLLKRTVEALDKALTDAEALKGGDRNDYILELDKAAGYASGVLGEATLLIGDIQALIQRQSMTVSSSKLDLNKLLGGIKSGGTN